MPGLSDLPNELLLLLPLSRSNTARMAQVCGTFHDLFTSKLYTAMSLNSTHRHQAPGEKPLILYDHLERKVPLLLYSLATNPQLLLYIRSLEYIDGGAWDMDVLQISRPLFRELSSELIDLSIELYDVKILRKLIRHPPKLKTLKWTKLESKYSLVHLRVVLDLVSKSSIQTIELHNDPVELLETHCYLLRGAPAWIDTKFDPLADPEYRATKGVEIFLNEMVVDFVLMEEVFQAICNLEVFTLVTDAETCREDYRYYGDNNNFGDDSNSESKYEGYLCQKAKMADLGQGLRHQENSLEKLTVLRNQSGVHCRFDRTLLGPLTSFIKLRHLRIDVSYLIGHHQCLFHGFPKPVPPNLPARPFVPPLQFSTLMPSSIERLDLDICPLQQKCGLKQQWTCCNDIISGLLAEKKTGRLANFYCISFTERESCSVRYCRDSCAPGKEYNKVGPYVTREEVHQWQTDCGRIGIGLSYYQRGVWGEEWDDKIKKKSRTEERPFQFRPYGENGGAKEYDHWGREIVFGSFRHDQDSVPPRIESWTDSDSDSDADSDADSDRDSETDSGTDSD